MLTINDLNDAVLNADAMDSVYEILDIQQERTRIERVLEIITLMQDALVTYDIWCDAECANCMNCDACWNMDETAKNVEKKVAEMFGEEETYGLDWDQTLAFLSRALDKINSVI